MRGDPPTGALLLRTEGLGKSFTLHLQGGTRIPVLHALSMRLHQGECAVLSGPSGAGKSTLLRSLYGTYRAEAGQIWVRHDGGWVDLAAASPRTVLAVRRDTIGYVSQFLRAVPRVCALDVVAEALTQRGAPRARARDAAGAMLLRLNLPERLHGLPPATFSGGEQQRVNLARGLLGGHPVLLLDEPTASLDAASGRLVVDTIRDAKARGIAVLAIVHDPEVRAAIADRTIPVDPVGSDTLEAAVPG